MNNKQLKQGFTLIELLVVVLIIGILAAVALPQYQKAVKKSRAAQVEVNLNIAKKNIDAYLLASGYPSSGLVRFTGANRVGDLDAPGNCDLDNEWCYTSVGAFKSSCSSTGCSMLFYPIYNADGTTGNKALSGWYQSWAYTNQHGWYIDSTEDPSPEFCDWVELNQYKIKYRVRGACGKIGKILSNEYI